MHASWQERVKEAMIKNSSGRIKIKHSSAHVMLRRSQRGIDRGQWSARQTLLTHSLYIISWQN